MAADPNLDYAIVTSPGELGEDPELDEEVVVLPGVVRRDGKTVAYLVRELKGLDFADYQESRRIYDKDNNLVSIDFRNQDFKFLARCIQAGGNRVFSTDEAAINALGRYGQRHLTLLLQAANRVNGVKSIEEQQDEGKDSEETPSGSSSSR